MPCLVNLIVYVTETREIPTINNFVMNSVGVTKSSTGEELAVHMVMTTNLKIMELENNELEPSEIVVTMTAITMNQHGRDEFNIKIKINGSPTITYSRLPNVHKVEAHLSCQGKAPAASIRTKVKIPKLANLAVQNIDDGECSTPVADNDEDNE
ncbi:13673_t:CDS:2 [Entrophospora sp. SA101]|nr:10900_t:CDS:2 [Entrophospora sp. SA101]CAJ0754067.1 13673_t:CDS:2 [Entrophospora sp. SA101]CAJ0848131.1 4125_t:CDS:2 [Entrophospora sp. SA101]